MRWRVWLALAALSAIGCAPTRAFEQPAGPHFSVVTYNVNYGGPGSEQTIDAIAQAGADIVCLQETTPTWERLLRAKLSGQYPHMKFLDWPPAGGLAVLSHAPITEIHRVPPTAGWHPTWVFRVQTQAGPVQVVNVHLRPSLSEDGKVTIGALVSTKAVRCREVEAWWPQLAVGEATIIAGDLNEGNGGGAVAYLVDRGMTDALPEFDRTSHTWRWSTRLLTVRARFDHVLYGRGLHCLRAEVLDVGASDHLPVMAVFQTAPAKQGERLLLRAATLGGFEVDGGFLQVLPDSLGEGFEAFARDGADGDYVGSDGVGESLGLLRSVGEVHLVGDDDLGLFRQQGGVLGQFVADDAVVFDGVAGRGADVHHVDEQAGSFHVAEEFIAHSGPLVGALDEPGEVGHYEPPVARQFHDAQTGVSRGEGVGGDFGASGGQAAQ